MKINYVPGLALRFYPGLSRELYDAVDTYIASNCKIAIFTGTAPTEQQVWDLSNFSAYVTANTANLVYQETTQLQFTYDGFKHKRVIQRYPVDSTAISPLVAPIAQDPAAIEAGALETPNSLYALVYCPDKDTTLNTTGNDLVILVPNVGSGPTDFCSLSKVNFAAGESMYFRNLTISLFQGYQITDTLINGEFEDPLNPGQMITGPVDSKKSVYINKVWGNRISEAYRDCFISRNTFIYKNAAKTQVTNTPDLVNLVPNLFQDYNPVFGWRETFQAKPRKYDKVNSVWTTNIVTDVDKYMYYGFIVNQSAVDLIDSINTKGLLGQLPSVSNLVFSSANSTWRFAHTDPYYPGNPTPVGLPGNDTNLIKRDIIPGLLAKSILTAHQGDDTLNSIKQILIEQGFDEGMITSALKSVIPIGFDNTKYNSTFDKDQNVLTIQNISPAKLKTRYKKSIHNPTNEQLYILIPRYLNRCAIETSVFDDYYSSLTSVSYPATQKVIDGEVVDTTTQRIRQQDYTAISIGITGNGETDLEYDLLDTIDYIDSFTAMIKIPNKF